MTRFRNAAIFALLAGALLVQPALAQRVAATTVETGYAFEELVERVKAAVKDNGLIVVYAACASCAALGRGIDIPGNAVIGAYNNVFAVRMLEASVEAGIEAPIELYVTGNEDGTAALTYRLPSDVFATYENAELDLMAAELDRIWAKIVDDATQN